jgi:hypothetical protein
LCPTEEQTRCHALRFALRIDIADRPKNVGKTRANHNFVDANSTCPPRRFSVGLARALFIRTLFITACADEDGLHGPMGACDFRRGRLCS